MVLNFKQWENLNEASVLDSIKNWLSGNFGGSVEKIDSLIAQMKKSETGYIQEWEDIVSEIDQLEIKLQSDIDAATEKATNRMIERKKQLLSTIKNKKAVEIENALKKADSIIKSNKRLREYWEKEKAQADVDIAKRMYDIAKSLGDDTMTSDLYNRYKKFQDKSTKLQSSLSKKYGKKFAEGDFKSDAKETGDDRLKVIAKKPLGDFNSDVKGMDPKDAKELFKICTEERNKLYVDMDLEIAKIEEEMKSKNDRDFEIEGERRIKKIKEKYLEKIREYRSKITLAKRYS